MTPPVVTTDSPPAPWLLSQLVAARVFDEAQVRPYLAEFRATTPQGDAAALAAFLVQAGVLTEYQAGRALAGEAGKLALGPYLLAEPVGSGSLGTVFQAVRRQDHKRFAVKVLPLRSLWNTHLAKKQVQVFAALPPHPAVVPFVDVDSAGGSHYLAWPFAEGTTLAARVARSGPLPVSDAVRVMAQAADGLAACHAGGVAHGLLKPSNVILGPDHQTRLLDLGMGAVLSENIADDESMLDTISTANTAMGMLDCCAPETLNSPTLRAAAGDAYSFGCVLYYVLTGSLPFPDGNVVDKVIAHQTQPPKPLRQRNPAVPAWLDELVLRLLAKESGGRPGLVEVAAVLRAGGPAAPAEQPSPPRNPTPWLAPPAPRPTPLPAPVAVIRRRMPVPDPMACDTPVDERTDPGLCLSDADLPFGTPTDPLLGGSGGWGPPDTADSTPAEGTGIPPPPLWPAAAGPTALTMPTEPTATPPERRPVYRPTLPRFAGSWWYRLKGWLFFWRQPADVIQVSVFGPPQASPGDTARFQAFVHTPDAFDSVCTLSRVFHADGELVATGYADREVSRGSTVGLHLTAPNAGVARSLVLLNWLGQPQPRTFEVNVPWESPAGRTEPVLSIGVNGTLAGTVGFELFILPRTG